MIAVNDEWIEVDGDASKTRFKLLVVDDSAFVRKQVKEILNNRSVAVLEAKDGLSALALLEKNPDVKLVLCDVNLSKMDGLSLVERLIQKSSSERPAIPVIMLTSENKIDLVVEGKKAGATGWITKPPTPEDIIALVEKYST